MEKMSLLLKKQPTKSCVVLISVVDKLTLENINLVVHLIETLSVRLNCGSINVNLILVYVYL